VHVLRALKDGLTTSSKFKADERQKYEDQIALVRKEFDQIAKNEVQKAFFVSFEDEAKTLLDNYIDNVEAFLEKTKLTDPITNEELEPNESLMRSIETKIGVSESAKDSFRNEVVRKVGVAARRGDSFRYDSHARLREAIEKQLFEERKDLIKMTITSRTKRDPEELKRINQVVKTLCDKHGYIPESANELLKYVSSLMMREK
jgi:serine protein kinase